MDEEVRKSSTLGAAINLAKTCIGNGVLALPFAILHGGLIFGPLVLAAIAYWNAVSCKLMIECRNYCQAVTVPRGVSSTYSKIAYVSIGFWGVRLTDFSIIITLLGVCVAFQITFASLISEIPGNFLSNTFLTVLSGFIVIPLCISKDVGYLAPYSFLGLVCLLLGIFVILVFGMISYGHEVFVEPYHAINDTEKQLGFFPSSVSDATILIGVAAFCFGITTLAFPIEESMANREEFPKAVAYSLLFVWTVYVIIGDGAALLYYHSPQGIMGNILMNLPEKSIVASFVRFSMACVCLLTFPLTLMPPTQIIEYFVQQYITTRAHQYHIIYEGEPDVPEAPETTRILIRVSLVTFSTILATSVPCFGLIVSLLGSFTVAILSFILPPLFHFYLIILPKLNRPKSAIYSHYQESWNEDEIRSHYYRGIAHIALGVLLSIVATVVTTYDAILKLQSGEGC